MPKRSPDRDSLHIEVIRDQFRRIERVRQGGLAAFLTNIDLQDATCRRLDQIALSIDLLSDEFKQAHAQVDWRLIGSIRAVLNHPYHVLPSAQTLWDTIGDEDLQPLKAVVMRDSTTDEHQIPRSDAISDLGTYTPSLEDRRRASFIAEADAMRRRAEVWGIVFRSQARWWRRINTALVVAAAILAAVSGGTALATLASRTFVGLVALAAAAISALASALAAGTRANNCLTAASADMALADAARAFMTTAAPYVPLEEAARGFEALCEKRDKVVAEVPGAELPWSKWYRRRLERGLG